MIKESNLKWFILLFSLLSVNLIHSQNSEEQLFNQARQLLAMRQINEAIPSLETLYSMNPENSNYNFLLGAAFRELGTNRESAIFHLKKAVKNISENYDASSYTESKAPMLTYYYLATAQVDNDLCKDAEKSLEKLKEFGDKIDAYFIREIDRNLQKCDYNAAPKVLKEEDSPLAEIVKETPTVVSPPKTVKPPLDPLAGMVTKTISYTTKSPLWGVQIGAFKEVIPTSRFNQIKNVDAFIDEKGLIRYVVGHFAYKQQAESLLEVIRNSGVEDAFIVDVNNPNKFNQSVVSVNNVNLKSGIVGKVVYKIQVGAFKNDIPEAIAATYLTVEGIDETNYEDLTLLLVGQFDHYDDAANHKDKLLLSGINDAFIVAFNNGKKISIREAKRNEKDKD
jgi:tetratricopeptide (TPR) repeat protein